MGKKLDFLIVGQGIAGSVLSLKLILKGYTILVFDTPAKNISSTVAAGIFNPITGRRMVKTWMAESLWDSMMPFYREAESVLETKFFHTLPHYRPFRTIADVNDFESSFDFESGFVASVHHEEQYKDIVSNPYGGIRIDQSGYLDINNFISSTRNYLIEKSSYQEDHFDEKELVLESESIKYGQHEASKIIYTQGWNSSAYTNWLPFKPVKGELLEVEFDTPLHDIFNRGVFVLPKKDGITIVGATYDHDNLDDSITDKARTDLSEKLEDLMIPPYQLKGQRAGIRPSTRDRRPFVGIHPNFETIGVLNGLGTKGVSLAPHFADELIGFIEKTGNILPEADIKRYYSLYLDSQKSLNS